MGLSTLFILPSRRTRKNSVQNCASFYWTLYITMSFIGAQCGARGGRDARILQKKFFPTCWSVAHARRTGGIVIKKILWNKFFTDVARSARAVGFKGGIVQKKFFFWKKHSIDVIYWCAAHAVEGKQKFFFLQKFKKIDVLYWLAMRGRRDEGILKKKSYIFFTWSLFYWCLLY